MMKLIRAGLMSAVMVVMMCDGVFAQGTFVPQGSAVVPVLISYDNNSNYQNSQISLSNITDHNIKCRVRIYDQDGADKTIYSKLYTGSNNNSWRLISSSVTEFDIPAHSSRLFACSMYGMVTKGSLVGYATIEWATDDVMLRKALLGQVRLIGSNNYGTQVGGHYLINNGQPF